jgi:hypothetical protein
MLCDICVGVIQHRRGIDSTYTELDGKAGWHFRDLADHLENLVHVQCLHHSTFGTLTDSVSRGCRICRSFWDNLSESERDIVRNLDTTTEKRGLTEMEIRYTTDHGYTIMVCVEEFPIISHAHGLEPGKCLS